MLSYICVCVCKQSWTGEDREWVEKLNERWLKQGRNDLIVSPCGPRADGWLCVEWNVELRLWFDAWLTFRLVVSLIGLVLYGMLFVIVFLASTKLNNTTQHLN